jgi:hypothetical protein
MTMRLVKTSTLLMVLTVACSLLCLTESSSAQSTYGWALSCSAATLGTGVGTGVDWVWLHNGVQISYTSPPNGFASCATPPLSGSGEIPASINGFQVNGIAVTLSLSEYPAGCQAFASVTPSPATPAKPKAPIRISSPSGKTPTPTSPS